MGTRSRGRRLIVRRKQVQRNEVEAGRSTEDQGSHLGIVGRSWETYVSQLVIGKRNQEKINVETGLIILFMHLFLLGLNS